MKGETVSMTPRDAVYATVHGYPGGAEALAPRVGMSGGILRNKANPNCDTNHLTLDEADRLMAMTNDYRILHALAANHGHVCTLLPESMDADNMSVFSMLVALMGEHGDVGRVVEVALSDGRVTSLEVATVKKEIYELQTAAQTLLSRLEGMVKS